MDTTVYHLKKKKISNPHTVAVQKSSQCVIALRQLLLHDKYGGLEYSSWDLREHFHDELLSLMLVIVYLHSEHIFQIGDVQKD